MNMNERNDVNKYLYLEILSNDEKGTEKY